MDCHSLPVARIPHCLSGAARTSALADLWALAFDERPVPKGFLDGEILIGKKYGIYAISTPDERRDDMALIAGVAISCVSSDYL